jgi:hypothetical protein
MIKINKNLYLFTYKSISRVKFLFKMLNIFRKLYNLSDRHFYRFISLNYIEICPYNSQELINLQITLRN